MPLTGAGWEPEGRAWCDATPGAGCFAEHGCVSHPCLGCSSGRDGCRAGDGARVVQWKQQGEDCSCPLVLGMCLRVPGMGQGARVCWQGWLWACCFSLGLLGDSCLWPCTKPLSFCRVYSQIRKPCRREEAQSSNTAGQRMATSR